MRGTEPRPVIGPRALFAAALAVSLLAGCSRAQWRRVFAPAPATATAAHRNDTSSIDCQPLLVRANEILTVPGDSLMGEAAVRTSTAYTMAMSDYSVCMARAAMP